uniref:hypothetical protein n=1 Tax=Caldalkalibacillus salinus TaxID=2803787 RepID=UPI001F198021
LYKKYVDLEELDDVYEISTVALYKGKEVAVRKFKGDIIISHGDRDYCKKNGFTYIDRGYWQKEVKGDELEKVWHEKSGILGF